MIWRGVSRTEWSCAALVTAVSVASTLLLMWYAAAVDEITDCRQARFESQGEFAPATPMSRHAPTGFEVPR